MVVMVRPAPLASTPTLPSSSMNLSPSALPRSSSSVSFSGVPDLASASRRGTPLSSIGELAIERDQAAVLGEDQGIDLHQLRIGAGIDLVEPLQEVDERVCSKTRDLAAARARSASRRGPCGCRRATAPAHRDACRRSPRCPCRPRPRTAAAAPCSPGSLSTAAYISRAIGNLRLDQHRRDPMLADRHAEDAAGSGLGLRGVCGELDAAGLAALARRHLRLDHARPDPPRRRLRPRPASAPAHRPAWRCRLPATAAWLHAPRSSQVPSALLGRSASHTTAASAAARASSRFA